MALLATAETAIEDIEIARGLPKPSASRGRYPWRDLEIGDAFILRFRGDRDTRSVCSAASAAGRRLGRRYAVRKEYDTRTNVCAIKVWRTE